MMLVYGIIVTYGDRVKYLKRVCEGALREGVDHVIIIDNNSEENSSLQLKKLQRKNKRIRVISFNKNYGSAGGFKRGLEEAYSDPKCEFIWLLDDDNQPQKESLNILRDHWNSIAQEDKNEKVSLMSFRKDRQAYKQAVMENNPDLVLGRKNSFLGVHFVDFLSKVLKIIRRKLGVRTFVEDKGIKSGKVSLAPYGGMFFHKKILESIGYPNEDFFLYSDDHEWSYRISQNSGSIHLVLDSIIDDIDTSWRLKEKSRSPFYAFLNEGDEFRVYYNVRNRVYFEQSILTNKLIYNIHMRFFLFIIFFYKRKKNTKQYNRFRQAINDGLNSKLGEII